MGSHVVEILTLVAAGESYTVEIMTVLAVGGTHAAGIPDLHSYRSLAKLF